MSYGIKLHVFGEFACFTRPEMKVERVSYDVMTPSSARGILEAIYWKPQIRWVIDRIHVLSPIRFCNIRRNEVSDKAGGGTSAAFRGDNVAAMGLYIEDARRQRASTLLRNVAYGIEAHFDLLDRRMEKEGPEGSTGECAGKHLDMFRRRARKGQYFHHPYMGTREFPASFSLVEEADTFPDSTLPEHEKNRCLGWILHDIDFVPATKANNDSFLTGQGQRVRAEPRFFAAELRDGILHVPPFHTATP